MAQPNQKKLILISRKRTPRMQGLVIALERFQWKALTENILGVLERWSLVASGH